jgi:heme iron utilization protein
MGGYTARLAGQSWSASPANSIAIGVRKTTLTEGGGLRAVDDTPAQAALIMLNRATKGALGTARAADGHPYVSMVLVASADRMQPVFLLSRLALHTKNLLANPASSLLIDETDAVGDPLAGSRVTFVGETFPIDAPSARTAFLARHPNAETYAAFADFGMYAMSIESAHLIQGFGRIITIDRAGLVSACA